MEYPVEYMLGIIAASVGLMMVAGIIIALIGMLRRERRERISLILLINSILMGFTCITACLGWFDTPSDSVRLVATLTLFIQYTSIFIPILRLVLNVFR